MDRKRLWALAIEGLKAQKEAIESELRTLEQAFEVGADRLSANTTRALSRPARTRKAPSRKVRASRKARG